MSYVQDYILKNLFTLNLNFTDLNWPTKYGLNFFDVEANFKFLGNNYEGRGSSSISRDHGIEVAFTEAYERMVIDFNKLNSSNGIASHVELEKAQYNALSEAIERTIFFISFYSKNRFGKVFKKSRINNDLLSEIFLGQARWSNEVFYVTASYITLDEGGVILGLGCSNTIEKSLEKSNREVMRFYSHHKSEPFQSIDMESFFKIKLFDVIDHARLYLDSTVANKLTFSENNDYLSLDLVSCHFINLLTPDEFIGCNLSTVKADIFPNIDYFTGYPSEKQFAEMKNCGFEWEHELLQTPHPLA